MSHADQDGCMNFLCVLLEAAASPLFPSSSFPSQPPEAYVDDEHDEEDATGCQLGIGGACVQIFGVAAVFLGQTGQVAGL